MPTIWKSIVLLLIGPNAVGVFFGPGALVRDSVTIKPRLRLPRRDHPERGFWRAPGDPTRKKKFRGRSAGFDREELLARLLSPWYCASIAALGGERVAP